MKIDKMFVDTLVAKHDAKRSVLDSIIDFARHAGLKTVAEGVETASQVEYLAGAGVYAIQGYVFSKPMPAQKFVEWMAARQSSSRL